ncbi:hypothetical protein DV737_g504, partial [Chaetothyriales sp. CBS 132003]
MPKYSTFIPSSPSDAWYTSITNPSHILRLEAMEFVLYLHRITAETHFTPSQADVVSFKAIKDAAALEKYPHASRWYKHIASYESEFSSLPGNSSTAFTAYGPEAVVVAENPKAAPADEDEDDVDLFGSDDEEEDPEVVAERERRLEEYRKKKEGKTKPAAKSIVTLDVKPWDDETDMKELVDNVLAIEMDGLVWGAHKLVPVGFGIKKLQVIVVVEDEKVSLDDLQQKIEGDEDHVQSTDIAAMQKFGFVFAAVGKGPFIATLDARQALTPITLSKPLAPTVIREFPKGTWLENFVIRQQDGNAVATLLTAPEVYLISTTDVFEPILLADFAGNLGVVGIAELGHNIFYVAVGNWSVHTLVATPGSWSVWEIDLTGFEHHRHYKDAVTRKVADLPGAGALNGMTVLNPIAGTVLVADSLYSAVWRVNVNTGEVIAVLNDTTMAAQPQLAPLALGINAINIRDGYLYYDNTDTGNFHRIPIDVLTGEAIGQAETLVDNAYPAVIFDDFTLDFAGNAFVVSGRGEVALLRDVVSGAHPTIDIVAGNTSDTRITGHTAAKFGLSRADLKRGSLYATTSGGAVEYLFNNWTAGGMLVRKVNAASLWATTLEQIKELYDSPFTGAVTTRTSLLEGFTQDDSIHQYIYHSPSSSVPRSTPLGDISSPSNSTSNSLPTSTLNTLGYSPITLSEYLGHINEIVGQRHLGTSITTIKKPFILSVTGTPDEIALAYALIANAAEMDEDLRLAMEVNLSNPNIPGKSPAAYDADQLKEYLEAIGDSKSTYRGRMASDESVPRVGIKLPPYTHAAQFEMVAAALAGARSSEPGEATSVIDFVTCTSTLGSSIVLRDDGSPALNTEAGTGIGGLGGAAIHPLALGNVATFRRLLDQHPETKDVLIIGAGGVEDKSGAERMVKVGAAAVAVASAMGRYGIGVFERIAKG